MLYEMVNFVLERDNMNVICPKCKSSHTSGILYGYPTLEAFEAAERGEIILGGCKIYEGQPDYGCFDCDYRWSLEFLPATAIKKFRFKIKENGPCALDDMKTWVYEIYPDGNVRQYLYLGKSRKAVYSEAQKVSERKTMDLFRKFQHMMKESFTGIIEADVCDGCSYNLQVTYIDNRKKIINGDVGGGTIDGLLMEFLGKIFDMN